jgi:molybdopterin synthase catalytic subunit
MWRRDAHEVHMSVEILVFAGLRERAGQGCIKLDVALPIRAAALLDAVARDYPALADGLAACRVAINHAFVDKDAEIPRGAEIALIPPVSGGHDDHPRWRLTQTPLSLDAVVNAVRHPGAGGIATFTGNVREHSRGQTISRLEYEAYVPMALQVIEEIARSVEQSIPDTRVAIHHRVGTLTVGETAVVIAASAPHRAQAFEACRDAIERLKRDVPIWKREVGQDGAVWLGQGP